MEVGGSQLTTGKYWPEIGTPPYVTTTMNSQWENPNKLDEIFIELRVNVKSSWPNSRGIIKHWVLE